MIEKSELLAVVPFTSSTRGKIKVPGSKSISNRALILSVMCNAEIELVGLLESEDVDLMQDALKTLGIRIEKTKEKTVVVGKSGILPKKKAMINVGNAGTIARFLTCLLATQKRGRFRMDGTSAMRKRPMLELMQCLSEQGCKIEYLKEFGHFPFLLNTNGLNNNEIVIDASKSGQNISGLLMQCPKISNKCIINYQNGTVSFPFIEMTLKMMCAFSEKNSINYHIVENSLMIEDFSYANRTFQYKIEPDATAASYFLTLPLITGGECEVLGLKKDMIQGDVAYCEIVQAIGGEIRYGLNGITSRYKGELKGGVFDFVDISDTFLTLAAISPLMNGKLEIFGIEHTRKQETDRVSGMACELRKLGQEVIEKADRLIIYPDLNKLKQAVGSGIFINTYKDHRFAMSFAILACFDLFGNGQPWLTIKDPLCCSKTFPDFFNRLNTLRNNSNG